MYKLAGAITIVFLLMPFTASAAVRKSARTSARVTSKAVKIDYNCNDFATQEAAQAMFLKMGGLGHDIYRLDADKDGIVCESLPK